MKFFELLLKIAVSRHVRWWLAFLLAFAVGVITVALVQGISPLPRLFTLYLEVKEVVSEGDTWLLVVLMASGGYFLSRAPFWVFGGTGAFLALLSSPIGKWVDLSIGGYVPTQWVVLTTFLVLSQLRGKHFGSGFSSDVKILVFLAALLSVIWEGYVAGRLWLSLKLYVLRGYDGLILLGQEVWLQISDDGAFLWVALFVVAFTGFRRQYMTTSWRAWGILGVAFSLIFMAYPYVVKDETETVTQEVVTEKKPVTPPATAPTTPPPPAAAPLTVSKKAARLRLKAALVIPLPEGTVIPVGFTHQEIAHMARNSFQESLASATLEGHLSVSANVLSRVAARNRSDYGLGVLGVIYKHRQYSWTLFSGALRMQPWHPNASESHKRRWRLAVKAALEAANKKPSTEEGKKVFSAIYGGCLTYYRNKSIGISENASRDFADKEERFFYAHHTFFRNPAEQCVR